MKTTATRANSAKQNNGVIANLVANELNNAPVMEQENAVMEAVIEAAAEQAAAATETPAQDTTPAQQETTPEFTHVSDFPTLTDGAKFEINGYKVQITGKEYMKDEKWPFTAWDATVTAPDGTEKTFAKVRNTAIMNYCHASTGISHAGGSANIAKVLTDEELASEATRRSAQIAGHLQRAKELAERYGADITTDEPTRYAAIVSKLTEDNEARKQQREEAKARVKAKEQKAEAREYSVKMQELMAAGKYEEAAKYAAEIAALKAQPTNAE